MADIELVIKIPDRVYYGIEKGITSNGSNASQILLDAVRNGTPLTKGHGDLIDRGKLESHYVGTSIGTDLRVYLVPTIEEASAIIEADKEGEE